MTTVDTAVNAESLTRTSDHRFKVFVSSTMGELAPEREAAKSAIRTLRLSPIMSELDARPHPPRELYRYHLEQSDIFIGIYWQSYGWVAPALEISGIEDEYRLAGERPRLIYVKDPAPDRDHRLARLLDRARADGLTSYKEFESSGELAELMVDDLGFLMSERFSSVRTLPRPAGTLTFSLLT